MASNPCCCCTPQTGAKIVAIFNIVVSIISIVGLVLVLTMVAQQAEKGYSSDDDGIALAILIVALIFVLAYMAICIVLLVGANTRNYGKCKVWFVVTTVILVLFVFGSIYQIQQVGSILGAEPAMRVFLRMLVKIGITGWQLWAVSAFMDEIKNEDTSDNNVVQPGFVHMKLKEQA